MVSLRRLSPRLAFVLATASGCAEEPRAIDPFPIDVSVTAGPVMVGALTASDGATEPIPVIVDTLSPVTVLDTFVPGEEPPLPRRRRVELTLFGVDSAGVSTVPRVRFPDTAAFDVHPCSATNPDTECVAGIDDLTVPIAGIVGADVLGRSAVRFDFSASTMRFFPDIAGDDEARTRECDALFPGPFAGGGTLLIAGTEVIYPARRPAIGICMAPPTEFETGGEGAYIGVDAVLLISTGLGMSVMSASAYDRYAGAVDTATPRVELPPVTVHLPSGSVRAGVADIPSIALVAEESDERGACLELIAHQAMLLGGCRAAGLSDCPCADGDDFCRAAASVDLSTTVRFAVIEDIHPFLQALRDELRPDQPELDGILGVDAMRAIQLELDYPNGRMLVTCRDPAICRVRPQVRAEDQVDEVIGCIPEPVPPVERVDAD